MTCVFLFFYNFIGNYSQIYKSHNIVVCKFNPTYTYRWLKSWIYQFLILLCPLDLLSNFFSVKSQDIGVPAMAQWLTNPAKNHEDAGSIPGLA